MSCAPYVQNITQRIITNMDHVSYMIQDMFYVPIIRNLNQPEGKI